MTDEDEAALRVSLELIGRDPHILDIFTESERQRMADDLNKIWDDILVEGGHLTNNERLYVADILIHGYMSAEEFCEFPLQKRREIMNCIFDFINKNEKKLCEFLRGGRGNDRQTVDHPRSRPRTHRRGLSDPAGGGKNDQGVF